MFTAYSEAEFGPGSTLGVVQPETAVTLYVSLVKRSGALFGWSTRPDFASLRVRLLRVA